MYLALSSGLTPLYGTSTPSPGGTGSYPSNDVKSTPRPPETDESLIGKFIDVESGICRIDVCGKLEAKWITDFRYIRDDAQALHEPDSFYLEDGSP